MRYQLIGGSYTVSFGSYAFDPWILKIAVGVPKELIWVEHYALDAAVIQLESLKLVKDFIALNSTDVGNCFVTILSLVLLRMRSFAVI